MKIFECIVDAIKEIIIFMIVLVIILACTSFLWLPWLLLIMRG